MGSLVQIIDKEIGWKDVVLPNGALKAGNLNGLIGFQENLCIENVQKRKIDLIFTRMYDQNKQNLNVTQCSKMNFFQSQLNLILHLYCNCILHI